MPLIQRNRNYLNNIVYSSGNYSNPSWINSLGAYKVGSGLPNWNASQIYNYPIDINDIRSGEYLFFTGSGWKTLPAQGGSGIASTGNIFISVDSYFGGKTTYIPHLNYEGTSSGRPLYRTKITEANSFMLSESGVLGLCDSKPSTGITASLRCHRDLSTTLISDLLFRGSTDPLADFNAEVTIYENNFEFIPGDILEFYFNSCDEDLAGVYISTWGNSLYGGGNGGSQGSGIYFTAESGIILDGSILKMGGIGQLSKLNFEPLNSYSTHSGILINDSSNGFVNLENTFIGNSFLSNSDNYMNVSIGSYCMSYASGNRNVAIGLNSLSFNESEDSIAIGSESSSNTVGFAYSNIAIGSYTLNSCSSIGNLIGIGNSAFNSVNQGTHSIAIGFYAGALSNNLYNNVFIGDSAGSYSSGSGNLFIGFNAGSYSIGNNNIELLAGTRSSNIGNSSNRLNISDTIRGDLAGKKISIGYAYNFSPSGTLHILPSGSAGIVVETQNSNIYDFLSCKAESSKVFNIDYNGNISGNNASFNVISGGISPSIIQSTGLVLSDFHHGKIIEHTGIITGVYTIGTITIPSWQCMMVNFGSGISIASGTNVIRSYNGYKNISNLYESASIYRRPNGEFFLGGKIN